MPVLIHNVILSKIFFIVGSGKKRLDLYVIAVIFTSNCTFLWYAIFLYPTSEANAITDTGKSYPLKEVK